MKLAKIVALSCITWSVVAQPSHAQTQQPYPQQQYPQQQRQFNPAPYYQWCDQVESNLIPSIRLASVLYGQLRFDEAKQTLVAAFNRIASGMNLPGTFRPNSHREIVRSLALLHDLEVSGTPASNLKSKMLAYVAINRANFVIRVKNILDRPYIIPYGPYGYQYSYGTPAPNLMQFETTLASVAAQQLADAQQYATVVRNRFPSVIPMVDAQTYFTVIGSAARWAAEDLSNLLFGQMFACGMLQLSSLGSEADMLAANIGEVASVQYIHGKVEFLKQMLSSRPYCNQGGYSGYDDGYRGNYPGPY